MHITSPKVQQKFESKNERKKQHEVVKTISSSCVFVCLNFWLRRAHKAAPESHAPRSPSLKKFCHTQQQGLHNGKARLMSVRYAETNIKLNHLFVKLWIKALLSNVLGYGL